MPAVSLPCLPALCCLCGRVSLPSLFNHRSKTAKPSPKTYVTAVNSKNWGFMYIRKK